MAKVDDLTIVISTEFKDNTSGNLKKLEKQLNSYANNIEDFDKKLKKVGNTNAQPVLSLKDQATSKVKTALDQLQDISKEKSTPSVTLKDEATPKIDKLGGNLREYSGKNFNAIISANDKASTILTKIESGARSITSKAWKATVEIADKATQPLRSVYNWLTSIKGIATSIFAGFAFDKMVVDPVGISDFYSTAQIGFETMLGSADKAKQMMDDINQFAIATPFEASGLVDVSQKMIAMGWSAERVLPDLEKVGNAMSALGKGQEGIERTTLALSQMQAKGKVSAEEMRQLTEVGISAWKYVADGIGVSTAEAQDMVTKGLIPVDQAIDSIMQGMSQFDGMMDKTANATVSGLLSQLQEAATVNLWKPWGEGLAKGIRPGLSQINDLMNTTLTGSLKLGDVLNQAGEKIGSTVMNTLAGAAKDFTDIISNPEFQTGSLAQKVKILLRDGVVEPTKKWWNTGGKETVKDLATSFMKTLGSAFKELAPVVVEAAFSNPITATLASSWGLKLANNFIGGLMTGMQGTKSAITSTISVVKGISNIKNLGLGGFKNAVKDAGSLTGALKQLGSASKSLSGGIGGTTKSISEMISNFKLAYQSTGSFSQALVVARSSISGMGSTVAGAATSTGGFLSSLAGLAPVALGVSAVVGAGIAIYHNYSSAVQQANENQKEYLNHINDVVSASEQLNEKIQQNIQTRTSSLDSVGAEASLAQELTNKIFLLKDAQDQSAGSHAQVKALVEQLNSVMPSLALNYDETTNELTDQNDVLVTNKQALLDRIDALKQEAQAEAAKELMTQAYKDQADALVQMNQLMPELESAHEQLNAAKERYNQLVAENPDGDSRQLITARQEVENLSGTYNNLRSEVGNLQQTYDQTGKQIQTYADIISGSNATALDSTISSTEGIKQKLNELPPTSAEVGAAVGSQFAEGVNSKQAEATQSGQNLGNTTKSGMESVNYSESGSKAGNSFLSGLQSAWSNVTSWFSGKVGEIQANVGRIAPAQNVQTGTSNLGGEAPRVQDRHAEGGIMDKPHIGLVAEDGPEAIIPLGSKRKSQGIKLWQEAGRRLGVYAHAEGGISSGSSAPMESGESSSTVISSGPGPDFRTTGVQDREKELINDLNDLHEGYLSNYTTHLSQVVQTGNDGYSQLGNAIIDNMNRTLANQSNVNNLSVADQDAHNNQIVLSTNTSMGAYLDTVTTGYNNALANQANINNLSLSNQSGHNDQIVSITTNSMAAYVNAITSGYNNALSSQININNSSIAHQNEYFSQMLSGTNSTLGNYISSFSTKFKEVVSIANNTMLEYSSIVLDKQVEVINSVNTNLNSMVNTYTYKYETIVNLTRDTMTTTATIVTNGMNQSHETVKAVLTQMVQSVNMKQAEFNKAGSDLMTALNTGINSKKNEVLSGAGALVDSLKKKFEEGLGIHSPSRWGQWVGEMIDQGVIKGMNAGNLTQFVTQVLRDMKGSFSAGQFNAEELINYLGDNTLNFVGKIAALESKNFEGLEVPLLGQLVQADGVPAIVQAAQKYVGYRADKPSIFGARYGDPYGEWCAYFVRTVAEEAGVPFPATGYVPTVKQWAISNGRWTMQPQAGYAAIYGGQSHIELVDSVSPSGDVTTIGGNTGSPTGVWKRVRNGATGYVALDGGGGMGVGTMIDPSTLAGYIQMTYNAKNSVGAVPYDGIGGAEQWTPQVLQALQMLGQPSSLLNGVLYAIQSESGGNPNAINDWDSNAAMGDPSRGLLQTIGSTFNAYRNPNLSANIYDPLSNIYAGLNYMIQRYGSVDAVVSPRLGHWYGYASGTENATPGLHWVGEKGPELMEFKGGEKVYSHNQSVSLLNRMSSVDSFNSPDLGNTQLNDVGASVISVAPVSEKPAGSSELTVNFDSGSFQFNFNLSSDTPVELANEVKNLIDSNIDEIAGKIAQGINKVAKGTPQNGSLA